LIKWFKWQQTPPRGARRGRADGVDDQFRSRAFAAFAPPVRDHPHLRKGERAKRADGKQRNELLRDAAEGNQEHAGEHDQNNNPARKDQPPSAVREERRQESILCEQPANTRKIPKLVCAEKARMTKMLAIAM
jgi:hypothetical protein